MPPALNAPRRNTPSLRPFAGCLACIALVLACVDGVLARECSHEVPQGPAWSFSAGTWPSTTPAQIDSITAQAQATCGFCAP
ncbi:MAG: hypothetical protein R3A48_01445 [Polyangiales bacterium]